MQEPPGMDSTIAGVDHGASAIGADGVVPEAYSQKDGSSSTQQDRDTPRVLIAGKYSTMAELQLQAAKTAVNTHADGDVETLADDDVAQLREQVAELTYAGLLEPSDDGKVTPQDKIDFLNKLETEQLEILTDTLRSPEDSSSLAELIETTLRNEKEIEDLKKRLENLDLLNAGGSTQPAQTEGEAGVETPPQSGMTQEEADKLLNAIDPEHSLRDQFIKMGANAVIGFKKLNETTNVGVLIDALFKSSDYYSSGFGGQDWEKEDDSEEFITVDTFLNEGLGNDQNDDKKKTFAQKLVRAFDLSVDRKLSTALEFSDTDFKLLDNCRQEPNAANLYKLLKVIIDRKHMFVPDDKKSRARWDVFSTALAPQLIEGKKKLSRDVFFLLLYTSAGSDSRLENCFPSTVREAKSR